MKILQSFNIFFILVIFQPNLYAATTPIGADTFLYTYACRVTYAGDCLPAQTPEFPVPAVDAGLQVNIASSVSQHHSNRYGSSYASAGYEYEALLPTLRAYAFSTGYNPVLSNPDPTRFTGETGMMSDANVWAVGHYRYFGTNPTWISFTARGDTTFTPDADIRGHSYMQIAAFTNENYRFDVDGGCPIFERCSRPNPTPVTAVRAYLDPTKSFNLLTINYFVNPGDEFYVGAALDANVCCNAAVDSSRTMTMEFANTTFIEMLPIPGLVIPSVPEPQFVHLLLLGLGVTIISRSKILRIIGQKE